jgi:NADH-ubiquinone oxidoreductase chain 5
MENQQVILSKNLREFTCQIKINRTQTQTRQENDEYSFFFFKKYSNLFYENKKILLFDMVLAIGLSQHNVALFHTLNHSFFKALLFLAAGGVIHSLSDQQDIRRMGGLIKFLPFTYTIMLIGSLSLLATPWLTGFYSKDLILELAYGAYSFSGTYAYILGSITAGLTAFYSFRLISLVFLTVPNASKSVYSNVHEANLLVILPLFVLALFSIFFGYLFSDLFVGVGTDFFGNSIFISPNNISIVEAEFSLPLLIKLLPSLLSFLGATLALYLYHLNPQFIIDLTNNNVGRKLYTFLNGKYFFDVIYNHYIIGFGLKLGYTVSKVLDRGVIELIGPYGLSGALNKTALSISTSDNRAISTYSLYIIFNALFLIFIVFAPMLINPAFLFEIRLFIIYIAAAIFVFLQNDNSDPDSDLEN